MKKLLALLIVAMFASTGFAADKKEPAKKPVAKKEVKHHKKAEGTKVPEPAKKK